MPETRAPARAAAVSWNGRAGRRGSAALRVCLDAQRARWDEMAVAKAADMTEIKRTLDGREHRYQCTLIARTAEWVALRYDLPQAARVGTLALPAGAVTVAHYWSGRSLTAYHWLDAGLHTLGVYLNAASDVRLGPDAVSWLDLALDVLVTAAGGVEVLDDDEARDAPAWAQSEIAAARRLLIGQASALASDVVAWTETALASPTQGNS